MEDPTDSTGLLADSLKSAADDGQQLPKSSDGVIRTALDQFKTFTDRCGISVRPPQHLKDVSFIKGKLPNLIDLKVIVVEKINAEEFELAGTSVSDWTFVILADLSGSVIGAFPREAPQRILQSLGDVHKENAAGAIVTGSLADLFAIGNILLLQRVKSMSCMGITVSIVTSHPTINSSVHTLIRWSHSPDRVVQCV